MSYERLKVEFAEMSDQILSIRIKKSVIRLAEEYEAKWGSPIYLQELPTIQKLIDDEIAEINMSAYKFYALRQFLRFCEERMLGAVPAVYKNIQLKSILPVREKMLRDPLHGRIFLNAVFPEKGIKATESTIIYQAYFWLVYMGVLDTDICDLTTDDVDLDNMKVYVNGIGYDINNEAVRAIKACATEDQFEYIHPKYRTVIKRFPEETEKKQLLHGVKGAAQIDTLKQAFRRINTKSINASSVIQGLSYQDIRDSGLFFKAYMHEITSNEPVRFYDAVRLELGDGFVKNRDDKIKQNHRYYLDKYVQWKLAFNLIND